MHDEVAVGQAVTLKIVFVALGAATDPTTVTLVQTSPTGATTTWTYAAATITKDGTGRYSRTVAPSSAGVWTYTWTAAGTVESTSTVRLLVGHTVTDGPCEPWADADAIFAVPPLTGVAAASRDYALAVECVAAASRILFALTGRRYPGICRAVVRPCRRSWGWCSCFTDDRAYCRCGAGVDEIVLGSGYPLVGVAEVRVDGTALASSAYRIDDDTSLVRIDGGSWPTSQDLSADPASDPATFQVTYWYGRNAPPDGVLAARHLAAQLYAASTAGVECSLPQQVRSKTLQGVELELIGPEDFTDGETGIETVDRFLQADRYGIANQGLAVVSPDYHPSERWAG